MKEYKRLTEAEAAGLIAAYGGRADIVTHASPDADTLGCALALCGMINGNGGDAHVVCPDQVPEYLGFLTDGVRVFDTLREGAARIAVDVASPPQLGRFEGEAGTFSLMLDHHERGEVFADNVVDADAAACGELLFRIIKRLSTEHGMRIPDDVPTYIYAAVSGDTGSFRFSNTTAETHLIAAELHDMGADTVRVAHDLHAVKTKAAMRARRLGLANMEYFCGGRLAVTSATAAELSENDISPADFSEADEMRSVLGVYVGVSLREYEPGMWRVSSRANVPVDCAAVCGRFGGGGHRGAAGCGIRADDRREAVATIAEAFSEAIEEYERGNK